MVKKGRKEIFLAYDIRGEFGKDLTQESVERIIKSVLKVYKPKKIVIGIDYRKSSESLLKWLIEGVKKSEYLFNKKLKIDIIGKCNTPALYYYAKKYDIGIMITASHLPLDMNGFKILVKGKSIGIGTGLEKIKREYENKKEKNRRKKLIKKQVIIRHKGIDEYLSKIKKYRINKNRIKIYDGDLSGRIYRRTFRLRYITPETVGIFPDPKNKRLLEKIKKINRKKEVIALFDGDADRILFIDKKGEVIEPDFIGALIGYQFRKKKNKKVVVDTRTAEEVIEFLKKNGFKIIISKCGHSYMEKTMEKHQALFGFETTGHYYFKESNYKEEPIIVLNMISNYEEELNKFYRELKRYKYIGEIKIRVKDKDWALKKVAKVFNGKKCKDGIKIREKDYWFNVRKSNTEDAIKIRFETNNKKIIENIKRVIKN